MGTVFKTCDRYFYGSRYRFFSGDSSSDTSFPTFESFAPPAGHDPQPLPQPALPPV